MIEATISLSLLQGLVGLLTSGGSHVPRGQFGLLDTVDRTTRTLNLHLGRERLPSGSPTSRVISQHSSFFAHSLTMREPAVRRRCLSTSMAHLVIISRISTEMD